MKDITITAQRQKIELCTLLACFVIANLVNLYAILSHDAPLSEMYTSLGYILVLTAAGIANGEDVYNTIIAGADATGSSSGVAKAADRAAMVDEMIAAVRKAWDERHK